MLRGVYKVPILGTLPLLLTCLSLFPRCLKLSWGWLALFNSLQPTDSFSITNINDLSKEIIDRCRQKSSFLQDYTFLSFCEDHSASISFHSTGRFLNMQAAFSTLFLIWVKKLSKNYLNFLVMDYSGRICF